MRADDLQRSTAHLAAHLRRSGVQFLPVAADSRVQQLVESFEEPVTESEPGGPTSGEKAEQKRGAAAPRGQARPEALRASSPASSADAKGTSARPSDPRRRSVFSSAEPIGAEGRPYEGPSLGAAERAAALEALAATVDQCTHCNALAQCRTKTVFGEGSVQPRFAFFGEGPGADEDKSGRPFVGRAGQLLTKMIEACTLKREECYILNTVKCRPPGNRNPEPEEIDHCREYFETQVSTLRPEYIVCLGAVAAQSLLKSKLSVGRMRGRVHRYFDSKVIVTYHPAYLLRNPSAKKAAWDDLQMMLRDAGVSLGG
ncbi:MAG: uracil-DNA glycosylase [Planctomycetota bacterium]